MNTKSNLCKTISTDGSELTSPISPDLIAAALGLAVSAVREKRHLNTIELEHLRLVPRLRGNGDKDKDTTQKISEVVYAVYFLANLRPRLLESAFRLLDEYPNLVSVIGYTVLVLSFPNYFIPVVSAALRLDQYGETPSYARINELLASSKEDQYYNSVVLETLCNFELIRPTNISGSFSFVRPKLPEEAMDYLNESIGFLACMLKVENPEESDDVLLDLARDPFRLYSY